MMKKLLCAGVMVAAASMASAHEFTDLVIDNEYTRGGEYYYLEIPDTTDGKEIICALYRGDGRVLVSESTYTDNLATRVIIALPKVGGVVIKPASSRCVFG